MAAFLFHVTYSERNLFRSGSGSDKRVASSIYQTMQTNPLFRDKVKEKLNADDESLKTYKDYVHLLEQNLANRKIANEVRSLIKGKVD